jgi:hypothetical protein
VNEAIWIPDGRPDGLRSSSPWFQMLDPGYIDLAFRTAREADPTALLKFRKQHPERLQRPVRCRSTLTMRPRRHSSLCGIASRDSFDEAKKR